MLTRCFICIRSVDILVVRDIVNDLTQSESNSSEFNDVVDLYFVAKLSKLAQRQPDFGVRVFSRFLVECMGMVSPEVIVFQVNQSNPGIEV